MSATLTRAYLIAWLLGLGTSLGCLIVLMLHHLVGGRWGATLRPALEAGARSLPVWALGFLPLALGAESLYPWADRAWIVVDASLRHKAWYLSTAGFVVRSLVSLALWSTLALALTGRSQADQSRVPLATFGLVVVFPSATISANDWIASLDPLFSSSMFGLYVLIGQILAGLSAAIVATFAYRPPDPDVSQDHGNLLVTAGMLWGYVAFSQYLLVWSGDLPHQAAWYLDRAVTPWKIVLIVLVIARVGLALPALLLRRIKRRPERLALVAGAMLLTHLLELLWLVLPSEPRVPLPTPAGLDLVLPVTAAAGWAWLCARKLRPADV